MSLKAHLEAILLDLGERSIMPTRLNVLVRALDTGVPEAVAVQVAELLDQVSS